MVGSCVHVYVTRFSAVEAVIVHMFILLTPKKCYPTLGPSVYWPGYQTYEISKTMTKFLSKSNRKKPWAINFEIGPIPTGDEIEVASAKGATQDLWVKGIYRTN